MATGVDKFHKLLKEFTRLSAWVLPTAGISPVIATLVGLNPPWPQKLPLTVATSMAVLVMLVAVFQFMTARSKRQVNQVMAASLVLGALAALGYFALFAALVYQTPVTGEAFSKGFQCTRNAVQLFGEKCPWLDLDELKSAEYEATRLWTLPSIIASRLSLLTGWFAMFSFFSVYLGAFLRHQSLKGDRRSPLSEGASAD
jgi:hypothetical protein